MEKEKQDIPNSAVTCIYWENPVLLERPEYGSGADVDIARKIAKSRDTVCVTGFCNLTYVTESQQHFPSQCYFSEK